MLSDKSICSNVAEFWAQVYISEVQLVRGWVFLGVSLRDLGPSSWIDHVGEGSTRTSVRTYGGCMSGRCVHPFAVGVYLITVLRATLRVALKS